MNTDIGPRQPADQKFNVRVFLIGTITLFRNNLRLFLGISLLGVIPALLETISPNSLSVILSSASLFIGIWAYIALVIAASKRYRNEETAVADCFTATKGKYWRVIGVVSICFLISLAGLLLFVIPGIYWGIIFCLSDLAVIIEGRKGNGSLKMSSQLIKGFFWKTCCFLAIISFPFLLPPIPALALTKTHPKLAGFLVNVFQALVMPFLIAGQVLLYHKLKEIKATEPGNDPEAINRSRSGCLLAAALIIAIIALSGIWISQIGRFIYSKTGYSFAQKVLATISPPIVFPEGVTLDRPSGRWVLKQTTPRLEYTLVHFKRQKGQTIAVRLYSHPLKDLGLELSAVDLSDQNIGKKIRYENLEKNELIRKSLEQEHGVFETRSIKVVNLRDHSWGECVLVASDPVSSVKNEGYVWKIYYTPVKDKMLIADFGYTFPIGETPDPEVPKGNLAEEEKLAVDMIGSVKFKDVE
ncbi:MAG: hypothetical protein HQL30_06760 [Candidatus Omnitrophica bacterium]|nr:hypothetical protein [Candidatus Omnitrophota bacterium]